MICSADCENRNGTPTACKSVVSAESDKVKFTQSSTTKTESYTKAERQFRSLLSNQQNARHKVYKDNFLTS